MEQLIIQAHLNEDVRDDPDVPITPQGIAENALDCVAAGVPWVHFHARAADGTQRPDDIGFYRDAISPVRRQVDVLWHPPQGFAPTPQQRWAHVAPLVEDPDTALELITVDPGSVDMMDYDAQTKQVRRSPVEASLQPRADAAQKAAVPPLDHWLWFLEESRRLGIKPVFGVLEPGYLRRILAWLDMGLVEEPLVVHFFLTERYSYGLPAEVASYETYLRMIPSWVRFVWFSCPMLCSPARQDELNAFALTHGGHLRTGLGFPPLGGFLAGTTNRDLVEQAIAFAERFGRRATTPAETRQLLGMPAGRAAEAAGRPA